jgi:thymidylate kinase
LVEANQRQGKIVVINADRPAEAVHADVMREVERVIGGT